MKRIALLAAAALGALATAAPAQTTDAPKVRVLLTYGGHDFQQKEFFALWDAMPGVTYTKAPLPASAGLLRPGLEKQYDVIVMYDMVKAITPEQRQAFLELLSTGIGVVSLHHNLNAHPDWPEYRKVIGGKWVNPGDTIDGRKLEPSTYDHDQDLHITVADTSHPITQGITAYDIHDEAYGRVYVDPSVHVLLTTKHPRNVEPVAWVTHYGKSPVVYIMGGHDSAAWDNPAYKKLLIQSVRWAAQQARQRGS
jgi:type 1 glutamine amidotransferase